MAKIDFSGTTWGDHIDVVVEARQRLAILNELLATMTESERSAPYPWDEERVRECWYRDIALTFEEFIPGMAESQTRWLMMLTGHFDEDADLPTISVADIARWSIIDRGASCSLIVSGTMTASDALRIYLNGGHLLRTAEGYMLTASGIPVEWAMKVEDEKARLDKIRIDDSFREALKP